MKEIKVPPLAESLTEGTIAKWLVQEGEEVGINDPIIELETDKVNIEIQAEAAGVLSKVLKVAGTDVRVGEVLGYITVDTSESLNQHQENQVEKTQSPSKESIVNSKSTSNDLTIPLTPSIRKSIKAAGFSKEEFQEKVLKILHKEQLSYTNHHKESRTHDEKEPNNSQVTRKLLSRRRRTLANRLLHATRESAMLTTFNEVDMTRVLDLRQEKQERFFNKHGIKLGFMSFFTKATVFALQEYPILNAELDGNYIIEKDYYDIGIAVASNEGLVVPVIREANQRSFAGIEQEIKKLSKKVKNNELSLNDLSGGTFTITNGGVFGSLFSTPILNSPQVGILGMHSIQKRPVALPDDTIEVRPMMYIALSYDHQLVDGKEAVLFLRKIKELVENPEDLLFDI